MRVNARENEAVNEEWTCDKGKFEQYWVTSDDRVTKPMIRRAGRMMPATWDEAIELVVNAFKSAAGADGGGIAGLAGTHVSNEDAYVFQKLFRLGFGSNNIDHRYTPFAARPMQGQALPRSGSAQPHCRGWLRSEGISAVYLWLMDLSRRSPRTARTTSRSPTSRPASVTAAHRMPARDRSS